MASVKDGDNDDDEYDDEKLDDRERESDVEWQGEDWDGVEETMGTRVGDKVGGGNVLFFRKET